MASVCQGDFFTGFRPKRDSRLRTSCGKRPGDSASELGLRTQILLCIGAGILARPSYIGSMKTISMMLTAVLIATAIPVRAQDPALEERVNKLTGYIQDLLAAQDAQRKQIEALAKDIENLREKIGQPAAGVATQDDLRKLAQAIQEVDDRRKADTERIARELEDLGKAARQRTPSRPAEKPGTSGSADKGYWYEVKSGDTLSAIIAAYREQGIKVTLDDILKANDGLKPTNMQIGQKIWIPAPQ